MEKKIKVSKLQKQVNYDYTILETVPYQLCPKCGGDGKILNQNWGGLPTSLSVGFETCNLCNGEMIIPMHIVENFIKKN